MRDFTRVGTALLVSALLTASLRAQDGIDVILASAAVYVQGFERNFGSVVAEERYEQEVRPANVATGAVVGRSSGSQYTVLVSDFLLVQVPGQGWLGFRDVFERDGKPVRDRQERLTELFLNGTRGAIDQVTKIMNESARYNIGDVNRNVNVPTLPLEFVSAAQRKQFTFTEAKRDDGDDATRVLDFNETGRPTVIRTTNNRDLPVQGRFWIDAATGTIKKTELHAIDTSVEGHITVTYQVDSSIGIWVPARMEERYRRARAANEVRGVATYSKFRRFSVNTSEELAK